MAGRKITFYSEKQYVHSTDPDALWVAEVARYLNTNAKQYKHGCRPGKSFMQCMMKQEKELQLVDIMIDPAVLRIGFSSVLTTSPMINQILVPRDRPLNVAELLLLPFSWQVWLLLLVVLTLAETLKHIFPKHFQNDPILLVVCGFERHNLHETGRWEKMILHSLIILMFFASNAFETRIISLMISKPSIQRVKTVNDLETYGIKFYADLDHFPTAVEHPIIGKHLINGHNNVFDFIPGIGLYVDELMAKYTMTVVFDYKRQLSWFVPLDFRYLDGFKQYETSDRNPFLEYFQHVHLLLNEAGIYEFWKQRYIQEMADIIIGHRIMDDMSGKIYLDLDDIFPAWMILGIGCAIATFVFLVELIKKRVNVRDLLVSFWKMIGKIWIRCKSFIAAILNIF